MNLPTIASDITPRDGSCPSRCCPCDPGKLRYGEKTVVSVRVPRTVVDMATELRTNLARDVRISRAGSPPATSLPSRAVPLPGGNTVPVTLRRAAPFPLADSLTLASAATVELPTASLH